VYIQVGEISGLRVFQAEFTADLLNRRFPTGKGKARVASTSFPFAFHVTRWSEPAERDKHISSCCVCTAFAVTMKVAYYSKYAPHAKLQLASSLKMSRNAFFSPLNERIKGMSREEYLLCSEWRQTTASPKSQSNRTSVHSPMRRSLLGPIARCAKCKPKPKSVAETALIQEKSRRHKPRSAR